MKTLLKFGAHFTFFAQTRQAGIGARNLFRTGPQSLIKCGINSALLTAQACLMAAAVAAPATGPLRVLTSNPRYFTDGSGKAVYLAGSHSWCNFATDQGKHDPPAAFDFKGYLDFLAAHNHNFFRGWVWELAFSEEGKNPNGLFRWSPHPWRRTGPGMATDGKPKFDLDQFNQEFFDRIRARTIAARDRGIYVSIMLFQGYSLQFNRNPADGFPLDGRNNINGVDAGTGHGAHTLEKAAVTARQEAYIKKIIESVNDLDNVLYEISNESGGYAKDWHYHMINLIHQYEASKPKQHPVGMTFEYAGGSNAELFTSPADWISPGSGDGYQKDPPVADGRKVVVNDTDHSFFWTGLQQAGTAGQQAWVWKNFLRGNYVLFMDPYLTQWTTRNNPVGANPHDRAFGAGPDPYWEILRNAMGRVRRCADRANLAAMTPDNALASTGYCLAQPGHQYLVYQPKSNAAFTINLQPGTYHYEWFNPSTGVIAGKGQVKTDAELQTFTAPFSGDAVLYLADKSL